MQKVQKGVRPSPTALSASSLPATSPPSTNEGTTPMTDPIHRALLDGTLYELHQLWCKNEDDSHDHTADPVDAALWCVERTAPRYRR